MQNHIRAALSLSTLNTDSMLLAARVEFGVSSDGRHMTMPPPPPGVPVTLFRMGKISTVKLCEFTAQRRACKAMYPDCDPSPKVPTLLAVGAEPTNPVPAPVPLKEHWERPGGLTACCVARLGQ